MWLSTQLNHLYCSTLCEWTLHTWFATCQLKYSSIIDYKMPTFKTTAYKGNCPSTGQTMVPMTALMTVLMAALMAVETGKCNMCFNKEVESLWKWLTGHRTLSGCVYLNFLLQPTVKTHILFMLGKMISGVKVTNVHLRLEASSPCGVDPHQLNWVFLHS